jgi:hypothetical protein
MPDWDMNGDLTRSGMEVAMTEREAETILLLIAVEEQRDALLEALRDLCDAIPMETLKADPPLEAWWQIAQAAIAKAEGK